MEALQPYFSYLGIGAAVAGGIALLLWIIFATSLSVTTEGIPQILGEFLVLAATGDFEEAYSRTTVRFQKSVSKQQLRKLLRVHQIQQYKRLSLPLSIPDGDVHTLDATVILTSGQEIPIHFGLVKQGKSWAIDTLSFPSTDRKASQMKTS